MPIRRRGHKLDHYFFINDELHKQLVINRSRDLIYAWNYPQGAKKVYTYTDVLRRHKPAFTTQEVCKMLNRRRTTIQKAIREGAIEPPPSAYNLETKRKSANLWREEDIMALHEYLCSVHIGRPRKDGIVTVNDIPSARELRAMIRDEGVLYVKQGDTFVPTWKAN